MSRPTETLAHKIAKHTGIAEVDVQYMFDNDPAALMTGPCWPWNGSTAGPGRMTPMMNHQGKPTPVRRILVGPRSLVICGHPFCVNPTHATAAPDRISDKEPEPAPPAGADEINELMEMLAEGFTETQLLTMYEPETIQEALRRHATAP